MADWIDYYDSTHTIYVSKLHRDVHFRGIARDIIAYIPAPDAVVLDYSCGEALCAPEVAAACGELILAEPAPSVRSRLETRFATDPNISVRSPDDLHQRPDASLDLAVMISVAQYMTPAELDAALALFRRLLKPTGALVVGDILDPGVGMATDVLALLKLGARHGFLMDAMRGMVRTALSDYRKLRTSIGLRSYSAAEMLAKLETAGFTAARAPANVGHNPARMTFIARPASNNINHNHARD
jgi:ubiquinone/menaquinone biosynthesis C-methylase UbiE